MPARARATPQRHNRFETSVADLQRVLDPDSPKLTVYTCRECEATSLLRIESADLQLAFKSDTAFAAEILQRTLRVVAGCVKATETVLATEVRHPGGQPARRDS